MQRAPAVGAKPCLRRVWSISSRARGIDQAVPLATGLSCLRERGRPAARCVVCEEAETAAPVVQRGQCVFGDEVEVVARDFQEPALVGIASGSSEAHQLLPPTHVAPARRGAERACRSRPVLHEEGDRPRALIEARGVCRSGGARGDGQRGGNEHQGDRGHAAGGRERSTVARDLADYQGALFDRVSAPPHMKRHSASASVQTPACFICDLPLGERPIPRRDSHLPRPASKRNGGCMRPRTNVEARRIGGPRRLVRIDR